MDAIQEPTPTFQFEKLKMTNPVVMSGGNHFIKYVMNNISLYIQPPTCKVKQGMIKTGKRMYCDLMFTIENVDFIQWLENLEEFSKKYIHENKEKWFETPLDEHDIDNSFTSPLKLYKSGKYYLVRVNIPTILGKPNLKVFDEQDNILNIEDVKENADIGCILELQGIKCSPRSFQIEIEMKQLLVLKPVELFEKCILHPTFRSSSQSIPILPPEPEPEPELIQSPIQEEIQELEADIDQDQDLTHPPIQEETPEPEQEMKQSVIQEEVPEQETLLEEVELHIEENSTNDKIFLKKRNDVYYELYREALRKATMAKKLALSSYLEANRIKKTYMLDDLDEEDESFDMIENE